MTPHRRQVLTALGTTGVAALAGCPSIGGKNAPKLAAADGDTDDWFGRGVAVAADSTTALVGAPQDDDPNGQRAGAAYVFDASGDSWTQQAKLRAADSDSEDHFGSSVSVAADGTTALVGAPDDEDPNRGRGGSAYVFAAAGGAWTQQAKLAADDGDDNDEFGASVAMTPDGTTAIVGAWTHEEPTGVDAGAAYVFERAGGSWTQQAKLAPADVGDDNIEFGRSVAMAADGTTALVGATDDEDPNGNFAGAAYVFERAGGAWTQQVKLVPADGDPGDKFGWSVAVATDGTTALVGAPDDDDPNGPEGGSAYVFERAGGAWTQQAKLAAADGDDNDEFGWSVAMAADGATAIVGSGLHEDPNGLQAGAAYIVERAGGTWSQQAKLAAPDGDSHDRFGRSVAMAADGTTALVGAGNDEDPNGNEAGSAYVFERPGNSWR